MLLSTDCHQLLVGDSVIASAKIGIDRMVMLLTDNIKIQEVLLFPAMKPEETETKEVKEVTVEAKEVTVEAKTEKSEKVKATPKSGKGNTEKEEPTKTEAPTTTETKTEAPPTAEPTKTEAPAAEPTTTEANEQPVISVTIKAVEDKPHPPPKQGPQFVD